MFTKAALVFNVFLMGLLLQGGTYDIPRYTIASGGARLTGGGYTLSGTVGQAVAAAPLAGGDYTLRGGFRASAGAADSPFDINADGFITPQDAGFVVNRLGQDPNVGDNGLADVDSNGVIDQNDVNAVLAQVGTVPGQ